MEADRKTPVTAPYHDTESADHRNMACGVAWFVLSILAALGLNWLWVQFYIPLPAGSYLWVRSSYTLGDILLAPVIALLLLVGIIFSDAGIRPLIQFPPRKPNILEFQYILVAAIGLTLSCIMGWFSIWAGGYAVVTKEALHYKPFAGTAVTLALKDICAIFYETPTATTRSDPTRRLELNRLELNFSSGEQITVVWAYKSVALRLGHQLQMPVYDWRRHWEKTRAKGAHATCQAIE